MKGKMKNFKFNLLLVALSSFFMVEAISASTIMKTLSVRADAWCPYNCEPGKDPGYGIEVLQSIFNSQRTVDYKLQPWQRALEETKVGKNVSAIGASAKDAKQFGLIIGSEPIGVSSNCVFVKSNSTSTYHGPKDLNQFKKIGIINEYTYSAEIDEWINKPENKSKLDSITGDEPAAINARKLTGDRLDAVVEDLAVMNYTLKKIGFEAKIKSAGCTKSEKIYIAFSSRLLDVKDMVKQLDEGIISLRKSGKLKEILRKYGVQDWK